MERSNLPVWGLSVVVYGAIFLLAPQESLGVPLLVLMVPVGIIGFFLPGWNWVNAAANLFHWKLQFAERGVFGTLFALLLIPIILYGYFLLAGTISHGETRLLIASLAFSGLLTEEGIRLFRRKHE